jgi:hypothetical protein
MRILAAALWLLFFGGGTVARAAVSSDSAFFLLPMSCAELLPDPAPYLGFFEAVGKGLVAKDRALSRRIFRVLSLREKLSDEPDRAREGNPVDVLIRKTLCYYREQKEPLKVVTFDDAEFLKFLRPAMKELEAKLDDTIFEYEYERQQRMEYRRQLERNRGIVESVQREADRDAEREYDRLSSAARRKVRLQ